MRISWPPASFLLIKISEGRRREGGEQECGTSRRQGTYNGARGKALVVQGAPCVTKKTKWTATAPGSSFWLVFFAPGDGYGHEKTHVPCFRA